MDTDKITVLGLDPGSKGAAALVVGRPGTAEVQLLGAIRWGPVESGGWELQWTERGRGRRGLVPSLPMVGVAIATILVPLGLPDAIVREAQYIGPDPHQAVRIGRNSGLVEGGLQVSVRAWREHAPPVRSLEPTSWRLALGLKKPRDREAAKAQALTQIPRLVPGLSEVLAELGQWDDPCEAAGLGAVGVRFFRPDEDEDQWLLRVEGARGPIKTKGGARRAARVARRRTR